MSFLHMLLAIALPFRLVCTRRKMTDVHGRVSRVLVIDMAITLRLRRPAIRVILAVGLTALPRT